MHQRVGLRTVASFTGARIETATTGSNTNTTRVASFTGVRIETLHPRQQRRDHGVASLTGAQIETGMMSRSSRVFRWRLCCHKDL